jgi:hypothetical protein
MAVPSRDEAVRTLEEGHARVGELLSGLSEAELTKPATIGGGDWSAKDLIGHLAFWEELALEAIEQWRAGRTLRVETGIFAQGSEGIDRANAEAVARKAEWSLEEVRSRAEDTHRTLLAEIESMNDEEWTANAFYPTERREHLADLLGSVLGAPKGPFGHASAHTPDLEAYVGSLA